MPEPDANPDRNQPSHHIRSHRQNFLLNRFQALSEIEQCMILAEMEKDALPEGAGAMPLAVHLSRALVEEERAELFVELLRKSPGAYDETVAALLAQHTQYFPALIAALDAAYSGEDIGLLTARGNRRGHQVLLDAIHDFLGFEIPRWNIYFVNDDSRNGRLPEESTAARKLQVLLDFHRGEYVDERGETQKLSHQFERVIFYDDERKNIDMVEEFAAKSQLSHAIQAVDATEMTLAEQWESLLEKIDQGKKPELGRESTIRFFDIDGTLIGIPAMMYVRDSQTGEVLVEITQEDFAHHPTTEHWFEVAQMNYPDIPREHLEYDFADFRDPERIGDMIENGWTDNLMFKTGGKDQIRDVMRQRRDQEGAEPAA